MHSPDLPRPTVPHSGNAAVRFPVIAFDLDGTLVDSVSDIAYALNAALEASGLAVAQAQDVRRWIGDGPDMLIERALLASATSATPLLRATLRSAFDAATLRAPLRHGAVFDGIAALLKQLRERRQLAVVTNKPTALARAVLDAAALLPWFSAVRGADTAGLRKPAPTLLIEIAAHFGVAPNEVLMVGDSLVDLQSAEAAGAAAALAGWGYAHVAARRHRHCCELAQPAQLLDWLRG